MKFCKDCKYVDRGQITATLPTNAMCLHPRAVTVSVNRITGIEERFGGSCFPQRYPEVYNGVSPRLVGEPDERCGKDAQWFEANDQAAKEISGE